jgi:hypothetical protein
MEPDLLHILRLPRRRRSSRGSHVAGDGGPGAVLADVAKQRREGAAARCPAGDGHILALAVYPSAPANAAYLSRDDLSCVSILIDA